MSRTFVFIALLFVTSYCFDKNDENVSKIIDELIELNNSVRTPKAKIAKLISHIGHVANSSDKSFTAWYKRVHRNCKAGARYLGHFIKKLRSDLATTRKGLFNVKSTLRRTRYRGRKLIKQIRKTKRSIRRAHHRHHKSARRYRKALLEADGKLIVIRHVRNIVVDELLNGKAPAGLVQVNTINKHLLNLKALVEKDSDSMFSSVVATLIEMTTLKNLSNQRILKKFLRALARLRHKILRWKKRSYRQRKRIVKLYRKAKNAKFRTLRLLARLLVIHRSRRHGLFIGFHELMNAIQVIKKALKRKAREGKQWKHLCADQYRVYWLFRRAFLKFKKKLRAAIRALLR